MNIVDQLKKDLKEFYAKYGDKYKHLDTIKQQEQREREHAKKAMRKSRINFESNEWWNDLPQTPRLVYCCIFEDDSYYFGLTCDFERRRYEHLTNKNSPIYKHLKTGIKIKEWRKLTDYIHERFAAKKEKTVIEEFEKANFKILNKSKGGEL